MPAKKTENTRPAPGRAAAKKPTTGKVPASARRSAAKKPAESAPAAKTRAAKQAPAKPARPAPERVPGRKERRGVVVSSAMDKTIVVRVDVSQKHDVYGKIVRRSSRLHVHDEHNTANVGDLVRVVETRPLSATKRWRLLEVLERAK
jgi:small subunit ribosomal protein S17